MNLFKVMRLFVLTVEKGSLTAAADEIGLTPTMVGNHLRALEEHVGMRLINRTTRQQHLTEFGVRYYERCKDILSLVEDSQNIALQAKAEPQGKLRISLPHAFGFERFMPVVGDYMARYPKVTLDVIYTDREVDLLDEGFEAVVRIGKVPDAYFVAKPLKPHSLVLCASPEYANRHGIPDTPDELEQHHCLTYLYSSGHFDDTSQEWHLKNSSGREYKVKPESRLKMNNGLALRQAAISGLGIALLPLILIDKDLKNGRLLSLMPEYQFPERPLHLLYLPERHGSPKLRSFVEFVLEHFG